MTDTRETTAANSLDSKTLLRLKNELHYLNHTIDGLAGLIAHNQRNPPESPRVATAQRSVIRRHERCLLQRVRLESQIRAIENSESAAYAMAFLDTARAHADAAEFERLAAITRSYIAQEVTA